MPSQIMCLKNKCRKCRKCRYVSIYNLHNMEYYVCRISSIRSLVTWHFFQLISSGLAFKPLSPSDSTDLSEARFSFPDSQNGYEDIYLEKSNNLLYICTFLMLSHLIISACLSRTSTIWPGSGYPTTSPDEEPILFWCLTHHPKITICRAEHGGVGDLLSQNVGGKLLLVEVRQEPDVGDDEADDHHRLHRDQAPEIINLSFLKELFFSHLYIWLFHFTFVNVWLHCLLESQRSWRTITTIIRIAFPMERM